MSTFLINDVAVSARTDWSHRIVPGGPSSRSEHRFPGLAMRLVRKGPAMPHRLVVTGFLETTGTEPARAVAAMNQELAYWKSLTASLLTTKVTVSNSTWENMELQDVQRGGAVQPVQVPGSYQMRLPVRFVFNQLTLLGTPESYTV